MKKYIVLASTLMVFAMFISSCDKDGIYNPKQKIAKICRDQEGTKVLAETWKWQDDVLAVITYDSLGEQYDEFEYAKKTNQLEKVISYVNGVEYGYTTLTYDKSLLQKMEMYSNDKLVESAVVEHTKKKITKITVTSYEDIYETDMQKSVSNNERFLRVMRFFMPVQIIENLQRNLQKSTSTISTIEITYDGDNVLSQKMTSSEYSVSITYTYDSYANPFYDALFSGDGTSAMALSKNNVLTNVMSYNVEGQTINMNTTCTYVYESKFPTQVKESTSYMGFESTSTTYYEYVEE